MAPRYWLLNITVKEKRSVTLVRDSEADHSRRAPAREMYKRGKKSDSSPTPTGISEVIIQEQGGGQRIETY